MTSMQRHGFSARELWAAARLLHDRHPGARLEGIALHLPLQQGSHLSEVSRLMNDVVAAELPTRTIWVSHLTDAELAQLRASYADYDIRPRIGTGLWLGDRDALRVRRRCWTCTRWSAGTRSATEAAPRRSPATCWWSAAARPTASASRRRTGDQSIRARAATVARGGLDAVGFVRSPFSIDGKQRLFAEPPHMQASMLFLPHGPRVPEVGDAVQVRVRYTATTFDRVVVS